MVYSGEKLQLAHLCLNMRIHGKVVEHGTDLRIWQDQMGKGTASYPVSLCCREKSLTLYLTGMLRAP